MIGFAIGVAVGALLGVPAFIVAINWVDARYLRRVGKAKS